MSFAKDARLLVISGKLETTYAYYTLASSPSIRCTRADYNGPKELFHAAAKVMLPEIIKDANFDFETCCQKFAFNNLILPLICAVDGVFNLYRSTREEPLARLYFPQCV